MLLPVCFKMDLQVIGARKRSFTFLAAILLITCRRKKLKMKFLVEHVRLCLIKQKKVKEDIFNSYCFLIFNAYCKAA